MTSSLTPSSLAPSSLARCRVLFLVFLTALGGASAVSAQPTYTIELLAFEQPTGSRTDPALWAFDAAPAEPAGARNVAATEPRSLNGIRGRLTAAGYRTIAHVAWQQPVLNQGNAMPTRVPLGDTGALGGYLKVWRGRYLHIDSDLHYSASGGVDGSLREARLKVRRKVPAGEAVYLDNEIFGVIAFLTR